MKRLLAALVVMLAPATASAITPRVGGPYSVEAEGSVVLDATDTNESGACIGTQIFPPSTPPSFDLEFRWDDDADGTWDTPWGPEGTRTLSAAGVDGPDTMTARVQVRCWYFDITSFVPFQGSWQPDAAQATIDVTVTNVAPVAGPITVDWPDADGLPIGSQRTFEVAASDVEAADVLTVTWAWSDGVDTTGNPTTRTTPSGAVSVTATVADDDGGTATATASFRGEDDPPTIDAVSVPTEIDEGELLEVSVVASDTDGVPAVLWRFADGTESSDPSASWLPPSEGTFTVELFVSDGNTTLAQSFDVDVVNVDPVIVSVAVPVGLLEGVEADIEVTATDAGGDVLQVSFDFGDGSATQVGATGIATHAWPDDGTYTLDVVVLDGDGGRATTSVDVTVGNVAPLITRSEVPAQLEEGVTATLSGEATDVPADVVSLSWDMGDGTVLTGTSVQHTWSNGTYTVTLTASDEDGGSSSSSSVVTVSDEAPVIQSVTLPGAPVEGVAADFEVSVGLAPGETATVSWDMGDGTALAGTLVSYAYADDGTYSGSVTVTDGGGNTSVWPFTVVVANGDPSLDSVVIPASGVEGSAVALSVVVSDVPSDPLTVVWRVDGAPIGTGSAVLWTPADDGTYRVSVVVRDDDGGLSVATGDVTVANVAPSAMLVGDTDDTSGQELSWVVVVVDPGAETFRYAWDFGDGATASTAFPRATHTYTANGTYTVQVTVDDGDGGVGTAQLPVVIDRIGPTIDGFSGPSTLDEGQPGTYTCTGLDLGGSGGLVITLDWGDGSAAGIGPTADHTWADDGAYPVTCRIEDLEGRSTQLSSRVAVANVVHTVSVTSAPTVVEGDPLSATVIVQDPGADTFTLTMLSPPGATVTAQGDVTWTAPLGDLGDVAFEVRVVDDDGVVVTRAWTVDVVLRDLDMDGMSDTWEAAYGLDPTDPADAAADPDGDGRTNLDEYIGGTDPTVSDAPGAPVLITPISGAHVPSLRPTLVVSPGAGDGDEPLTFDLELYADAGLLSPMGTALDVVAVGEVASWTLDVDLTENATYWWRARASDGWADGPWSSPERFVVDVTPEPPGEPTLIWPPDGVVVTDGAVPLEWSLVTDPEGDAVTYTVTLDLGVRFAGTSGLVPMGPTGTWTVSPALGDGAAACWTVRAVDATGLSAESEAWCFEVDEDNLPPSRPSFIEPLDGDVLSVSDPDLVVLGGDDPEGRAVSIRFEVSTDPLYPEADTEQAIVPVGPGGETRLALADLPEDTVVYARALADDGLVVSAWDEVGFRVNADDRPPTLPELVSPADGERVLRQATLTVRPGDDPDGLGATTRITLEDALGDIVGGRSGLEPDADGLVRYTTPALVPGTYVWTASMLDGSGTNGAEAQAWTLVVPADEELPSSRDVPDLISDPLEDVLLGCTCSTRGGLGGAWVVVLALLGWRRRV